jgi:WhiB family transcriptional regulator, redox-sensing transcriptional regulator
MKLTSALHHDAWSWRSQALCRDNDFSLFFHPDGERGHARRLRQQQAKRICLQCPVIEACREHSLRSNEPFGTWGGLTEDERAPLLSRQAVAIRTHRRRASTGRLDAG